MTVFPGGNSNNQSLQDAFESSTPNACLSTEHQTRGWQGYKLRATIPAALPLRLGPEESVSEDVLNHCANHLWERDLQMPWAGKPRSIHQSELFDSICHALTARKGKELSTRIMQATIHLADLGEKCSKHDKSHHDSQNWQVCSPRLSPEPGNVLH